MGEKCFKTGKPGLEMVGNSSEMGQNGLVMIGNSQKFNVVYFFVLTRSLSVMADAGNLC